MHNIVRTLKTYGHEADLRSAANMEQIVTTLAIAIRWSRRKLELQTKEVDVSGWNQLFKSKRWRLVAQVLKRILNKRNPTSNYTPKKWFQKKKDARKETHANLRAKELLLPLKHRIVNRVSLKEWRYLSDDQLLDMCRRKEPTSAMLLTMSTHSLQLLLQKWGPMSWCGWFTMKLWWESLIETSLWQQKRCLLRARWQSQGVICWGAL